MKNPAWIDSLLLLMLQRYPRHPMHNRVKKRRKTYRKVRRFWLVRFSEIVKKKANFITCSKNTITILLTLVVRRKTLLFLHTNTHERAMKESFSSVFLFSFISNISNVVKQKRTAVSFDVTKSSKFKRWTKAMNIKTFWFNSFDQSL